VLVCQRQAAAVCCRCVRLRSQTSFLFTPFLEDFSAAQPFLLQQVTTNFFMISFLSRTLDLFFSFLSSWIYLWLAETSQQPISQTTWLKVTPHCNHYTIVRIRSQTLSTQTVSMKSLIGHLQCPQNNGAITIQCQHKLTTPALH